MFSHKLKRIGLGLLAALLLASSVTAFTACANPNNDKDQSSETESSSKPDGINGAYASVERPEEKYNKPIVFVTSGTLATDVVGNEEEKGETLTDSLINRKALIEEDFGVTIQTFTPDEPDNAKSTLNKQVSANLDDFDVYYGERYTFAQDAMQNKIKDLNSVLSMDLYNPWWDAAYRENLVVDGHNFMITGDITTNGMLFTTCMVFNKRIMDDLKKEYPYDLVEDGEWTLDRLLSYTDGVTNESLGRYGLTAWHLNLPFDLYYGAGEDLAHIDPDTGLPVLEINKDRFTKIYEKIYDLVVTQKSYYTLTLENYESTYKMFTDGNAMFTTAMLGGVSTLTHMEDDYGLLPVPKYDAAQKDYRSFTNSCASVYMALTEKNSEMVGNILEAMGAYSYEFITPQMYNIVVKSKDVRDPDSARMVDYIIENRVFDFAWWADLKVSNVIRDELIKTTPNRSIASALNSGISTSNSEMRRLLVNWERFFG